MVPAPFLFMGDILFELDGGYIKIWRKMLDSAIFNTSDAKVFKVALYCLMKATHKLMKFPDIVVQPGSFVTSLEKIAAKNRISKQNARSILKKLENCQFLTRKSTNKYTLISIINWHTYQIIEKKSTHKLTINQQTTNKQLTPHKNDKNIKNNKKKEKTLSDAKRILDFFNKQSNRELRQVESNLKPFISRLNDGYSVEDISKVISYKCNVDEFYEKNPQHKNPLTICRKSKFDLFLDEVRQYEKDSNS